MGGKIPHDWKVESWNARGSVDRCFAVCDRLDIGIAAYEAAIAAYPNYEITLRHGSHVLRSINVPPYEELKPAVLKPTSGAATSR